MSTEWNKLIDSFFANTESDVEIQIQQVSDIHSSNVKVLEVFFELFEVFEFTREVLQWHSAPEVRANHVGCELKSSVVIKETDKMIFVVFHSFHAEIAQTFLAVESNVPA